MEDLKKIFNDRAYQLTDHDPWRYGDDLALKADMVELEWVKANMNKGAFLDAACGTGRHCIELAKRYPDTQFDAFDFATNNITIFNKKVTEEGITTIRTKVCGTDEMRSEYGDKKFDTILGIGLTQYLDDAKHTQFLGECYKLLNHGGVLMLKNPISFHETFVFDGYSELLKNTYFSKYRNFQDTITAAYPFFDIEKIERVFTLKNLTREELDRVEHHSKTRQMWFLFRRIREIRADK